MLRTTLLTALVLLQPVVVSATIVLRVGDVEVRPGETVDLPLYVDADVPVDSVTFVTTFESDAIVGLSIRHSSDWRSVSLSSGLRQSAGLMVGAGTTGENPIPPQAVDPVFVWKLTIQAGASPATIPVVFSECSGAYCTGATSGELSEVTLVNGSVTIVDEDSEPEPGAAAPFVQALPFVRGDSTSDARLDLADAVYTLGFLFRRGVGPSCSDAADANDDGAVNVSDPVLVLQHLFRGQVLTLPVPFNECGYDPTPDGLGCEEQQYCL